MKVGDSILYNGIVYTIDICLGDYIHIGKVYISKVNIFSRDELKYEYIEMYNDSIDWYYIYDMRMIKSHKGIMSKNINKYSIIQCDEYFDKKYPIDEKFTKHYQYLIDGCIKRGYDELVNKHLFIRTKNDEMVYREKIIRKNIIYIYGDFVDLLIKENILYLDEETNKVDFIYKK